jgi:hypothetical protein
MMVGILFIYMYTSVMPRRDNYKGVMSLSPSCPDVGIFNCLTTVDYHRNA